MQNQPRQKVILFNGYVKKVKQLFHTKSNSRSEPLCVPAFLKFEVK